MKRIFLAFILVAGSITTVLADVAPDPGFTRQPVDLILETESDLSAYRFFLDSMTVEEVKFSGNKAVVQAEGRGGAMRSGMLIAVPLSDMTISGDLSGPLLENFIRQKKFPNAKILITHSFQQTITIVEKPLWNDPVYRVDISANGEITATKVSAGTGAGVVSRSTEYLWPIVIVSGIVAVLFTVAIGVFGVWLFRRKKKKV